MPQAEPDDAAQSAILLCCRQKRFAGSILNTAAFLDGDETTGLKDFTEWKPQLVYAKDIRKPEMGVQD